MNAFESENDTRLHPSSLKAAWAFISSLWQNLIPERVVEMLVVWG